MLVCALTRTSGQSSIPAVSPIPLRSGVQNLTAGPFVYRMQPAWEPSPSLSVTKLLPNHRRL